MAVHVGTNDVLCGKGQRFMKHPGNIDFRQRVRDKVDTYEKSDELSKKGIIDEILASVQSQGGRFLILDSKISNHWLVVDPKKAREKTAQALRDCRIKRGKIHHKNEIGKSQEVRHDASMDDNSIIDIGNPSMMVTSDGVSHSLAKMALDLSEIFKTKTEAVVPRKHDVLCGSGKGRMMHPGNQDFRRWVHDRAQKYNKSDEGSKGSIVEEVTAMVEQQGGRFLRQGSNGGGTWHVISPKKARDKTAQAFRDLRAKRGKRQPKEDGRDSPLSLSGGHDDLILPGEMLMDDDFNDDPVGADIPTFTMSHGATANSWSKMSMDLSGMVSSKALPFHMVPSTYDVLARSGDSRLEHSGIRDFRAWVWERSDTYDYCDFGSRQL